MGSRLSRRTNRLIVAAAIIASVADGSRSLADGKEPCPESLTEEEATKLSEVFEGVVVDQWSEVVVDDRIRILRTYKFQVLRSWRRREYPEAMLTHGWYALEGSPPYETYESGERYLVFSNVHDMPAHQFAHPCFASASGRDIDAVAARLGPPTSVFDVPPPPPVEFWVPLARRARMYLDLVRLIIRAFIG